MSLDRDIQELRKRRVLRIEKRGDRYEVAPNDGQTALMGSSRRVVFIVHGYNNTGPVAQRSFTALYDQLAKIVQRPFLDSVWELYWPGYWSFPFDWSLPFDNPISFLSYSEKADESPAIGEAFAAFLERWQGEGKEALFLAHSLGCRVVLETIRALSPEGRCKVPGICLMAAAVPTFMIEDQDKLRPAADKAEKRYILHSRADLVLRAFFSPGQFLVDRRWTEAVGRFGNPRSFWQSGHENLVDTNLGHSDYYTGIKKGSANRRSLTASTIGRLFGRALPMYPHESDPYVVDWKLPSQPTPPGRFVPEVR